MTAWIWLLTGACAVVAIPILMPLMYGNAFRPAIWPAILLIPAAALSGQAGILEESLRAQGRAFIGLEARVAELAAFLIVGWILTRHYGVIGTAIAFGFAQAVALVIMVIATSSHFSQGTLRDFVPRARDLRELAFRLRTKLGTLRLRRS
jgi:O-antigen/teichoic acid export membrane protein